ncbi:hypothetical protein [Prosthecobacter sp.]|uniref:hypothetical protein n=1 Tax=Prosthecobacter sp. TaxID=1965333 RepID=UPI003783F48A
MKSLLLLLLVFWGTHSSFAAEAREDWLTTYYKAPTPDAFSEEVRALVDQGVLKNENSQPPLVAFLSRVMAANPTRIAGWLEEFSDLAKEQRQILLAAAWYSDTDEAREVFQKEKQEVFLKKRAPNILEMEVNNPSALDMLWGYFMATGDAAPIHRIVTALSLAKHAGALERFKTSEKTDKDKETAYLDATFQSAMWSLQSNCTTHPRVLEHCEAIYADKTLPADQGLWLATVLAKVKPETYLLEMKKRADALGFTLPAAAAPETK